MAWVFHIQESSLAFEILLTSASQLFDLITVIFKVLFIFKLYFGLHMSRLTCQIKLWIKWHLLLNSNLLKRIHVSYKLSPLRFNLLPNLQILNISYLDALRICMNGLSTDAHCWLVPVHVDVCCVAVVYAVLSRDVKDLTHLLSVLTHRTTQTIGLFHRLIIEIRIIKSTNSQSLLRSLVIFDFYLFTIYVGNDYLFAAKQVVLLIYCFADVVFFVAWALLCSGFRYML